MTIQADDLEPLARAPIEDPGYATRDVALVDLLDRVLGGGVVIVGDITISVADVDLVHISLRTLISSVGSLLNP